MKKFKKYLKLIYKDAPGFIIRSFKKTGEGDNSKAFIVNKNYIFRFPKREEVKQQVRREIAILPKLKSLVNLQIPQFEFISPEINFVGYKIIAGSPLTSKIYNSLSKKQQAFIQQSLGHFLSQLHHIDLSILSNCHLELMNPKEEYSDNFKKAQKLIYPHISKSKQKIITQLFTEYLDSPENFNYIPVLLHNDLSADHILFDRVNNQITGIIDFGDVAFGDPDYDLMYLWDEFGDNFLKGIPKIYQTKKKKELLNKLFFFSLAGKIQIILANRTDTNSEDVKNAYKQLSAWFKKFNSKKIIYK